MAVDPLAEKYPGWSPYNYVANNPIKNIDPDGNWIDTFLDIASVAYDLYDIGKTIVNGESVSGTQVLALGADVVCAIVPFAAGGGTIVRAAAHAEDVVKVADNVVDIVKTADKVTDGAKTVDKVSDATKTLHGNSAASTKATGNYELKFESGKTYNGVGNEKRMEQSAKNIEKQYPDKVVDKTYTPAANRKEAYIKEHQGIQRNGGAGNTQQNYNRINSPGKKLIEQQ